MKNIVPKISIILILIGIGFSAYNVIDFEISCRNDRTTITINTSSKPSLSDTVMASPDRLVLDFRGGIHQLKSKEFSKIPPGLVMRVRSSQFKPEPGRITRLVFDLADSPKNYTKEITDEGIKISIPTKAYPVIDSYKSGRKANIPPAPQEKVEEKKTVEPAKPKVPEKPIEKPAEKVSEKPAEEPTEKPGQETPKDQSSGLQIEDKADEPEEKLVVPDAPESDVVVDTSKNAYYLRSKIEYERKKERDPFLPVKTEVSPELGQEYKPRYDDIRLVGIVGTEDSYDALMQDSKGFGYMFEIGDSILNGIVTSINDTAITFEVNEYGFIRDITLKLEMRKK